VDKAAFAALAGREGYSEVVDREFPAAYHDGEHHHAYDARLLITEGEFTVTMHGRAMTYRPGDVCEVPAGTPHSESVGDAPTRFVVARRHRAS